ncbi:hypothetical protein, partial [Lutimonas sp.]|uniref:hypothetical protein n=1 Tax=Lutimonas sp. TaxID=1872403 RepID=UPI003D9AFEFF
MRLFFLLVFIGLNTYSQKINIEDLRGYLNSSLDTLNNTFELYYADKMVAIDLESFEINTIRLQFENETEKALIPLSYFPLRIEKLVYFVQSQGGMVFTIHNDTIKRIDNSYDHGMQYGASIFKHNNTVFKYGGYGFWSVRDFFTYYDKMQHEWEVYHPIESATIPKGLHGAYWIKDASRFYVFNGQYINENNRRQNFKNTELWSFDFSTNTWNL